MEITIIGLIVIPLTLIVFCLKRDHLVYLAIALAPFYGSAVLNIGDNGITPYYFVLIFILFSIFTRNFIEGNIKIFKIRYNNKEINHLLLLLSALLIYSGISLFFPFIFLGLGVYDPRFGIDGGYYFQTPLEFRLSNFVQFIYVLLNCFFVKEVIYQSFKKDISKKIYVTYLISGIAAALVSLWQFSGLPFPVNIFNSNAGFSQVTNLIYSLGKRLSGTFPEASYNSAFLAAFFSTLLTSIIISDLYFFISLIALICSGIGLILTLGSTGYLAVFLSIPFVILSIVKTRNISYKKYFLFFGFLLVAGLGVKTQWNFLSSLISEFILNKADSLSAVHRFGADEYAYSLLFKTFGIGVGIGSNRPSGFLPYLASNLGIIGIIFFIVISSYPLLLSFLSLQKSGRMYYFVGYMTNLIAMSTAIPDLSWPFLWIYIALVFSQSRESCN